MKNQHITDFLSYYLKLENSPEYAVLINAKWGAGKTHFVKNFLKEHFKDDENKKKPCLFVNLLTTFSKKDDKNKKIPYLFVSLYGLSTFSEIDDAIFAQAHPILSLKGMAIAGKILKTSMKFATQLPIDFNDDGKSDTTINSQVPDIKWSDILSSTKDTVLIFDDLERCAIEPHKLLGYLNYFVEHGGCKVILIANEDEFLQKEEKYQQIKEKLIGKTFTYQAVVKEVIPIFIGEFVQYSDLYNLYCTESENIISIFNTANHHNFRVLKQALNDFKRLFDLLSPEIKAKGELLSHLLAYFIVYNLEAKSGKLSIQKILNNDTNYLWMNDEEFNQQEAEIQQYIQMKREFDNKYNHYWNDNETLKSDTWLQIIQDNILIKDVINNELLQSAYFQIMPNWYYLWEMYRLTEDECNQAFDKCVEDIKSDNIQSLTELLHLYGLFCELENLGIRAIESANMCDLLENWLSNKSQSGTLPMYGESYGRMYYSEKNDKFEKFHQLVKESYHQQFQNNLPHVAVNLLDYMKNDTEKFYEMLIDKYDYLENPILKFINLADFITAFQELNPQQVKNAIQILRYRLVKKNYHSGVQQEKEWCEQLLSLVKKQQLGFQGGFGIFRWNALADILNTVVNK